MVAIMVFTKPIEALAFEDVQRLMDNKITESHILDYKIGPIDDESFIKHVSSFANTNGGYLIYGVEETGSGGYPKSIPGLPSSAVNKERLEQLVLSNIYPRIFIKLREIDHSDAGKTILVIQIPDSYLKPHMNLRSEKFYKRYNFEAKPMTETEVSDAYKTRFETSEQADDYVRDLVRTKFGVVTEDTPVVGQILVVPSVVKRKIVDTSRPESLAWINSSTINLAPSTGTYVPGLCRPSSRGVVCQDRSLPLLEIHRNGALEYRDDFATPLRDGKAGKINIFHDPIFCVKLLRTLQFAALLYSKYNYFGDVRVVAAIGPASHLYLKVGWNNNNCGLERILVEREYPMAALETRFSQVAAGIMDEIYNYFGVWRCPYFDDQGNYDMKKLRI